MEDNKNRNKKDKSELFDILKNNVLNVKKETLQLHLLAPETRIASSLSCVEIFVVLFYGNILKYKPDDLQWEQRDRFIISKGHGAISLYPILADVGYFDRAELPKIGTKDSFLGGIPDPIIPGFETVNGSLGHGLGVACGIALGLRRKKCSESVFVLAGDGELSEGSVWEAVMFAGHNKLDNLVLIVDNNKIGMLDYCENINDLCPLVEKFKAFRWHAEEVDGHDIEKLYASLERLKNLRSSKPKMLVAQTIKGNGVSFLENDPLCHIRTLTKEEVSSAIKEIK
ncbi:MAG: transketolase [Candidatus Omnitrophica bacterium]|nr:transketolase [Candidatus Omnitrophota bacterium]